MSKPEGSKYNEPDSGGAWGDLMMAVKARAVYERNGGAAGIIVPPQTKHPREVRPCDAVLPQHYEAPAMGKAVRL